MVAKHHEKEEQVGEVTAVAGVSDDVILAETPQPVDQSSRPVDAPEAQPFPNIETYKWFQVQYPILIFI